ncbi:hypothetical protein JI721_15465 [Alicyclobacillus cycloheptanicus]|uniref:Uncharacterized protein n=1 Tax=Alicyclobacillus cycloheptanicus TaxID=1457 RepID=A0ABT9XDH3_9BACL|nr:hypothetical protein [Alicyclobacillus cycloheptanicus]MDQ0188337.1 hypothetical protein [Alicyclobacillus cycloheptanicus]WDM01051.1 hypothetical protein JI721_15465 [Alicyclobacillus cycloheptanicus]
MHARRQPAAEHGSVLLTTLSISLCAAAASATMLTLVTFAARTLALHTRGQQAYWMARSVAVSVLNNLRQNAPQPSAWQGNAASGASYTVTVSQQYTTWVIKVTAQSGGAEDEVYAIYNSSTKRVTTWQDNRAPGT